MRNDLLWGYLSVLGAATSLRAEEPYAPPAPVPPLNRWLYRL